LDALWKSGFVLKNGYGKNRAILPITTIFQYKAAFPKGVQVRDGVRGGWGGGGGKKIGRPFNCLSYASPTLITTRLAVTTL